MGKKSGLIDAVEACYSLNVPTREAWLRAVLEKLAPLLDEGRGGMAIVFDARGAPRRWRLERPLIIGQPDWVADATLSVFEHMPDPLRVRLYREMGPVGTYAQATRSLLTELPNASDRERADRASVANCSIVNASNPDGRGASFVFITRRDKRMSSSTHPQLARISTHIASGFRLASGAMAREPVAVFEPSGKEVHVEGAEPRSLRAALRGAVVRQDRARGRLRHTDEREAVRIWQSLVAGRYSLIDRFESDGRRYVVAHENPPSAPDPRGLTAGERIVAGWVAHGHSDKLIAYELGWPEGTVRATTHQILRKLGLRSRVEIVKYLRNPPAAHRVRVGEAPVVALHWKERERGHLPLTAAEGAIVALIVEGRSTREIAALRGRSPRTIANQLASIYSKLGVQSRAGLTRLVS